MAAHGELLRKSFLKFIKNHFVMPKKRESFINDMSSLCQSIIFVMSKLKKYAAIHLWHTGLNFLIFLLIYHFWVSWFNLYMRIYDE